MSSPTTAPALALALVAEAVRLAECGLEVLPLHSPNDDGCTCSARERCSSPGKHPRTARGLHDATDNVDQVAAWWRRWPRANVGVRVPAGRVILDVDPRAGGDRTLAALLAEHGPLPTTLVAGTGGGGTHVWLRFAGPAVGRLGAGLDVKSHTGYVVAPPSVHASGQPYQWATVAPVAEAPGWLADRLVAPGAIRGRRAPRHRGRYRDGAERVGPPCETPAHGAM